MPDNIIYLRPDFPFRNVNVLNKAINLYNKKEKADGLRSVQESTEIPFKTWRIIDGYLNSIVDYKNIKDPHNAARQLFPTTYWPVGYIDIYDTNLILSSNTLCGAHMIPFLIENEDYINIGSQDDLDIANRMISNFQFD